MKLTGLKAEDITQQVDRAKTVLEAYNLVVISPWDHEKNAYKPSDVVKASPAQLGHFWHRDKELIESCHVVVDLNGDLFSKGTSLETGFNRYCLMRPTIWIDTSYTSVRKLEGDLVCHDLYEAGAWIHQLWRTRKKRILWRLKTIWSLRKVVKRILREIGGWR